MKRFILGFLLIVFSITCFSQEYDQLVETGKIFSIGMHNGGGPIPTVSHYTLIGEDTTINEIIYKKLLKSESGEEFAPTYSLIGLIRETEDRKVYLRDLNNIEGLYYDYYVEVGDTIDFYNPFIKYLYDQMGPEYGEDTVAVVEDIYFETFLGVSRKIYRVNAFGEHSPSPEIFIEGIGAETGITEAGMYTFFALIGSYSTLLCVENNDEYIYQNGSYGYCFVSSNNIETIKKANIYPNPCSSYFYLELDNNEQASIEIYNLSGNEILKIEKTIGNKIDIADLSAGVYILRIIQKDEITYNKIIVD